MKKQWMLRMLLLFVGITCFAGVYAQQLTVTGAVTDKKDGTPLPGVSILIKGTSTGVVTDIDGRYSIKAKKGQVLTFSFVGYKPVELVVAGTVSNVGMEADQLAIDEVVVIGYGTVKKSDATGSVSVIGTKDFNNGAITAPDQLITGRIAGVQVTTAGGAPGTGASIRIRGGSSLSAKNDPLIVVDGVPLDNEGVAGLNNPLTTINPNDIENFTVLKDASATAIYGSRASNGVIIITTKKGKLGARMQVSYAGNVSIGTPTKTIDVLSGDQFRALFKERGLTSDRLGNANTNWQDQIYRMAISTDHNVGLSGALKSMPYRLSIGITDENGILKTSEMDRTTAALSLTPSFFGDHLKVNLNGKYSFTKNNFADQGAIGSALRFNPTVNPYSSDPLFAKFGGYFTDLNADLSPDNLAPANPLALLYQRKDAANVNRFIGNAQLDYTFHGLPELRASLNLAVDNSYSNGNIFVPENAAWLYRRNSDGTMDGGAKKRYKQNKENQLLDFYFNYNKEFKEIRSKVDFTAGYSWQYFKRDGSAYESNVAGTRVLENTSYITENFLISLFARLNYVLNDRYLITATIRRDGSSRFGPGYKWGMFPSVALGWNMKNENFLKDVEALSALKLRLGFGITGQQDINNGDYPYLARYTRSEMNAGYIFGDTPIQTLRPDGYDPNLKWEETTTYNIALDFGFLKNRITGTVDFYQRETRDLLNFVPIPAGANLTNMILTNVGSLENRGVEFNLNSHVISSRDFNWELGFNATYNKNKITKLTGSSDPKYLGVKIGGIAGGTGNTIQIHSVSYAAGAFYVYEQVYDEKGKPIENLYVDRNRDGVVNELDMYRYKNAAPDVTMGINSRFTYKNWDFSFAGRLSLGNYNYNNVFSERGTDKYLMHSNGYLSNVVSNWYNTRFTGSDKQYLSDYYVRNASFFRMDNISLGYSFSSVPKFIKNLRLFGTVQNAFLITKYNGLDPEILGGIDNNIYPRPRTFLFGVNLTF